MKEKVGSRVMIPGSDCFRIHPNLGWRPKAALGHDPENSHRGGCGGAGADGCVAGITDRGFGRGDT